MGGCAENSVRFQSGVKRGAVFSKAGRWSHRIACDFTMITQVEHPGNTGSTVVLPATPAQPGFPSRFRRKPPTTTNTGHASQMETGSGDRPQSLPSDAI